MPRILNWTMHNAKQSRDKYVFFWLYDYLLRALGNIIVVSNKSIIFHVIFNRNNSVKMKCKLHMRDRQTERGKGLSTKNKGLSKGNLHILVINKSIYILINIYLCTVLFYRYTHQYNRQILINNKKWIRFTVGCKKKSMPYKYENKYGKQK